MFWEKKAGQMIHVKCQALFLRKKKIFRMSSATILNDTLRVYDVLVFPDEFYLEYFVILAPIVTRLCGGYKTSPSTSNIVLILLLVLVLREY